MNDFYVLCSQIIAQEPAVTFPVQLFRTHNGGAGLCGCRQKLINGPAKFFRGHIIGVVAKSWALEGNMGRAVAEAFSPKTAQFRKPGVGDTIVTECVLKICLVEVGITFRARIRSDVGEEFDSVILQQSQECLAGSVSVADGVQSGHGGNITQNVLCLLVALHCRSCGHCAIESEQAVG